MGVDSDGKEVSRGGAEKFDRSTVLGPTVGDVVADLDGDSVVSGGIGNFEISATSVVSPEETTVGTCDETTSVGFCVCEAVVMLDAVSVEGIGAQYDGV
jgi:hypothetical protein